LCIWSVILHFINRFIGLSLLSACYVLTWGSRVAFCVYVEVLVLSSMRFITTGSKLIFIVWLCGFLEIYVRVGAVEDKSCGVHEI